MINDLQIRQIERYHRHLQRVGRATTIEQTARIWIGRYAKLWRLRLECRI